MRKYSRGEFLSLSAILAGAAALTKVPFGRAVGQSGSRAVGQSGSQAVGQSLAEAPDLIVVNGRVLTQDPALARAEAFAVKQGRFIAVGSNSDVRNLATRATPVIDAA